MKFNFKKIGSVLASVAMLGSTIGIAAAANYPKPFVDGSTSNVAIVYGATADAMDFTQAGLIKTDLSDHLTGTGGEVTGGESIDISTGSQAIYMGGALNVARTILTYAELPTTLVSGTATDTSGTEYDYDQKITLGARTFAFSKSGENIDPVPVIDLGSSASDPAYNYTLTLRKILNVSDSTVAGESELIILGQKYIVGANSDYNTLYLYGSGQAVTVDEGAEESVEIDGTSHTVSLKGTSSSTAATIVVDGTSRSVTKGNSYKFAGDFEIYVKDLFHATKTGTLSSADLLLGANTLHLENGQAVKKGSDDTTVTKTTTTIAGTSGEGINEITIAQSAESSTGDYVAIGGEYTDRVFGGLKLQFASLAPALDSEDRDSIVIDTDNAVSAKVTFTRFGTDEQTFTYAKDSDNTADSSLSVVNLVDSGNYTMHVLEGENAKVNELLVVHNPSKDEGRILEVGTIPAADWSSSDKIRFTDVLKTSDYWDFTLGTANTTSATIDGAVYYISVSRTGDDTTATVNMTWGTGASDGYPGDQITLFPRIKLESGEWMSFLAATTIRNDTTYQLPGKYLLTDYTTGAKFPTYDNTTQTLSGSTYGNVNYSVSWDYTVDENTGLIDGIYGGSTYCNFSSVVGPAILIEEEKTLADSNGYAICIPLTSEGTTTTMPAIGVPAVTDGTSSLAGLSSDSYKGQQVTTYGTLVERDTTDNNMVTVSYPDEQMTAKILFSSEEAVIGGDGDIGDVVVTDAEISSVDTKNLIVVGGSCINSVAAEMLGGALCTTAFEAATTVGAGEFLIRVKESPYSADAIAVLVAGYEAEDTQAAATYLTTKTVPTVVGGADIIGTTTTLETVA